MNSFFNFEPVHCPMSSTSYCFLSCIQVSPEAGKVVWHSHLFKNIPQFVMIHTNNLFGVVSEAEVDLFWNSLAFFMSQ